MDGYNRVQFNLGKQELPSEYAHLAIGERGYSITDKLLQTIGILILLSPLFIYLWSIRPIYHHQFYRLGECREIGGIALLIFYEDTIHASNGRVTDRFGHRRILVNVETGRQIRLSYLPWRNYNISNLVSCRLVLVRNSRNDGVALMDINTRRKVVPFGAYQNIWGFRGNLAMVVLDGYMGTINVQTGEEIIPPNYFKHISFIYGTERFVAVTNTSFGVNERYRWGVLCLYTHELLAPFAYQIWMSYKDGMIALNQDGNTKLVDLTTGKEIIPFGYFSSIFPIGYGMAQVGHWDRNLGNALIEISTRDIWADYGQFYRFGQAYNYEIRVEQRLQDGPRRLGTFSLQSMLETGQVGVTNQQDFDHLDSITVIWDDELTAEELAEVHIRFNIHQGLPAIPEHLSHYDQVRILSNSWALVRYGDYSRFVKLAP